MKQILLAVIFLLVPLLGSAFPQVDSKTYESEVQAYCSDSNEEIQTNLFSSFQPIQQNNVKTNNPPLIARSGCCSHHGGVCGCSGNRIMCCDGTLSPSCTCSDY